MAKPRWHVLHAILVRALRESAQGVADAELLARYVNHSDAAAFELLVHRHADLVWGACRRTCADEHDAEDAFQATFVILSKRAGGVRGNLAGWLHRTARRAALRAAARRSTLRRRELPLAIEPAAHAPELLNELRTVLDEEIDRLPERLRVPLLLCYAQGRSTEEAAADIGVPRGTVLSRLAKARDVLGQRLTRRGITAPASAGTLTLALSGPTATAALANTAIQSALIPAAGSAASLIALEVLHMTALKSIKAWAAALVVTAGIGTGTGVMLAGGTAPGQPVASTAQQPPNDPRVPAMSGPVQTFPNREQQIKEATERLKTMLDEQSRRREEILEMRSVINSERLSNYDSSLLLKEIQSIDQERLNLERRSVNLNIQKMELKNKDYKSQENLRVYYNYLDRYKPEYNTLTDEYRQLNQRFNKLLGRTQGEVRRVERELPDSERMQLVADQSERMKLNPDKLELLDQMQKEAMNIISKLNKIGEEAIPALRQQDLDLITAEEEAIQQKIHMYFMFRKKYMQQYLELLKRDELYERHTRALSEVESTIARLNNDMIQLNLSQSMPMQPIMMNHILAELAELKAEVRRLSEKP